jgi:hypothetical protein
MNNKQGFSILLSNTLVFFFSKVMHDIIDTENLDGMGL